MPGTDIRRQHASLPPMTVPKSKTWAKNLRAMVAHSNPDERAMQVQLIRLWVLYADLEVEVDGATADRIDGMDRTSVETRRFYFVRRTTATLMET